MGFSKKKPFLKITRNSKIIKKSTKYHIKFNQNKTYTILPMIRNANFDPAPHIYVNLKPHPVVWGRSALWPRSVHTVTNCVTFLPKSQPVMEIRLNRIKSRRSGWPHKLWTPISLRNRLILKLSLTISEVCVGNWWRWKCFWVLSNYVCCWIY